MGMRHSGAMSTKDRDPSVEQNSPAPMAAIIAPALAFGATIAARKVLTTAYRSVTGKDAPSTKDPDASLASVIAWAAISGATIAVVEALIVRGTARYL